MNIEDKIRQLARSSYWQEIYTCSKDCSGINIFKNRNTFSGLQSLFLYWLRVYSMLYSELSSMEWENLDEKVIDNNSRCDAFLYWRAKTIEKDLRKMKREERKQRNSKKKNQFDIPIFSGVKNTEDKEGDE